MWQRKISRMIGQNLKGAFGCCQTHSVREWLRRDSSWCQWHWQCRSPTLSEGQGVVLCRSQTCSPSPSPKSFARGGKIITNKNVTRSKDDIIDSDDLPSYLASLSIAQLETHSWMVRNPIFLQFNHIFTIVLMQSLTTGMFVNKLASREPRVLDLDDCPPQGHWQIHYINQYLNYYDPIYYPELHVHLFMTAESCTAWLQADLNTHLHTCEKCAGNQDWCKMGASCLQYFIWPPLTFAKVIWIRRFTI